MLLCGREDTEAADTAARPLHVACDYAQHETETQ